MAKNIQIIIYILVMVVVIVGVDLVFLRHQFRRRLIVNIVIVLVFGIVYLLIFKK